MDSSKAFLLDRSSSLRRPPPTTLLTDMRDRQVHFVQAIRRRAAANEIDGSELDHLVIDKRRPERPPQRDPISTSLRSLRFLTPRRFQNPIVEDWTGNAPYLRNRRPDAAHSYRFWCATDVPTGMRVWTILA